MLIKNCAIILFLCQNCKENLSFDEKSWSLEKCLYFCLTIYHPLGATNMVHFLINIDMKPQANFDESFIKTLRKITT